MEICEIEVAYFWNGSDGTILERLSYVCRDLDKWFKWVRREKRINVSSLRFLVAHLCLLTSSDDVLEEMVNAKLQMNMEVDREEIYWEQRERANWLKNGDRNTAFFHKFASQRKWLNHISCLEDSDGRIVEGDVGVGRIAHDYFVNLLSTQGVIDEEDILLGVEKCITDSMNADLDRPFTKEEIFGALLSMSPLKASGEDGLEMVFYQRFWPILGNEVACYCIDLLKVELM
ncbi:hypothetical protein PVK06_046997 [Gossypium arboreum]|uniref:Reverse transcriptase n=1 Tax=Gossypium arboreum TaxID=29729 RepID=A0ABR0MC93_GOSAR|nr:hypothetical protein PVK06_046997 [Gossypium arboreum]